MRKMNTSLVLIIAVTLLVTSCTTIEPQLDVEALDFTSNITISHEFSDPSLNDSVQTIVLSFTEELDPSTIGAINLYRIDAQGNEAEVPCIIKMHANSGRKITINTKKLTRFTEGEAYKLVIGTSLQSKKGSSLEDEYVGYFATNNTFRFQGTPELNNDADADNHYQRYASGC